MKALKASLVTALQARFSGAAAEIIDQCGGEASPGLWDFSPGAMSTIVNVLGNDAAAVVYAAKLRDLVFRAGSTHQGEFSFGSTMMDVLDDVGGATYPNMAEELEAALFGVPHKKSYLWRNFATGGLRAGEFEVYVPYEISVSGANKTTRYAVFSFQPYVTGAMHLGRLKDGAAGLNTWHSAATKMGNWITFSDPARIPGGSTAHSSGPSDYIDFPSISGHTIVLRYHTNVNGGFAYVSLDSSYTSASLKLPAVQSSDYKVIGGAGTNGTLARVTCAAHGFVHGAVIHVENVGAPIDGTWQIAWVDPSTFDLVNCSFTGSLGAGGTSSSRRTWGSGTSACTPRRPSTTNTRCWPRA